MLLYTEEQLEASYKIYRLHQIKQDLSCMTLNNFRKLYEELAEEIMHGIPLWNNYNARIYILDHGLKDKGFAWTRRIIALVSVLAIVVLPKLVAVYYPTVDVTVGYTNWNPGFWFFREGRDVFEWITFQGLVITQLDTNLVSAIIGMYFGGSLVKK